MNEYYKLTEKYSKDLNGFLNFIVPDLHPYCSEEMREKKVKELLASIELDMVMEELDG